MKLKRISMTDGGEVESIFVLSQEQYYGLLQHAINDLMLRGVLEIVDMTDDERTKLKEEHEKDIREKFLEAVDPKTLHQA